MAEEKTRKLKLNDYQFEKLKLCQQLAMNYKDVAMKLYIWKNLPNESMTSDIIERFLYDVGCVVYFDNDNYGNLVLPPVAFTNLNVYGVPQVYGAQGVNGEYFSGLDADNSVLIKNTPNFVPTRIYIETLCESLADVIQARKVNVNATKTPFVIEGEEQEVLSMKNLYEQISGNKAVIYKNKTKAQTSLSLNVLKTDAPYTADKLTALKNAIECDALTYLGLNNNNIEKKERLVSGEVEANNEIIENYLFMRLKERKDAVEKINKMFGTKIEVDINREFVSQFIDLKEETDKIEVKEEATNE